MYEIVKAHYGYFTGFLNTTGGSLWYNRGLGTMLLGSLEPALLEIFLANTVSVSFEEFCNGDNEEKDRGKMAATKLFNFHFFFFEKVIERMGC